MLLNRERARAMMVQHGLDALVATSAENVTYATGFANWTIYTFRDLEVYGIIPREGPIALVVPIDAADYLAQVHVDVSRLYAYGTFHTTRAPEVTLQGAEAKLFEIREEVSHHPTGVAALSQALTDLEIGGSLGVDERGMPPARWRSLVEAFPRHTLSEAHDFFRAVRMVKTAEEIMRLRTAVQAVEHGMLTAFRRAVAGVTEAELETAFREAVVSRGVMPGHFETSAGTRSAGCFPTTADYHIQPGDIVRSDSGGRFRGYWADTGRTAALGVPPAKLARYYDALHAGITMMLGMAKPGVPVADLYRAAMETVRSAGIPHYQRHHVGHAIGLEFYEAPVLVDASRSGDIHRLGSTETRLEPGMVVNIELPYYELGLGGLQIEDTLVIRPSGYELLTTASRTLLPAGA